MLHYRFTTRSLHHERGCFACCAYTMSASRPENATAEQQLLALQLNQARGAVRTGVSAKDPALWRFTTQLQVEESDFNAAKRAYEQFFQQFQSIVTNKVHQLAVAHPGEFGRFQNGTVNSTTAGSVANTTHFVHSDLDRILILNPRHPVTYSSDADSLRWGDDNTPGASQWIPRFPRTQRNIT